MPITPTHIYEQFDAKAAVVFTAAKNVGRGAASRMRRLATTVPLAEGCLR